MAKLISFSILLLGALLSGVGLVFIVLYFKDAIFLRTGEADQSLIFWYLPFLFVGLGSLISGIVVAQAGLRRLKKSPETP